MEAQADLTRVGNEDQKSKQYPSFVRGGVRYVPRWVTYHVGDLVYNIAEDCFNVVLRDHTTLAVGHEPAMGEPNTGETPVQLGYRDPGHHVEPYQCRIPDWITHADGAGLTAQEFAAGLVELMARKRSAPA